MDTSTVTTMSAEEPNIFDFRPRQAPRVRRAWERAPASPRAPGRKGRKVWKRAPVRAATDEGADAGDEEDTETHGHGVKRQRTRHLPAVPARATRKKQQFVSTLQDQALGTPKRKVARRRTLRNTTLQVPGVRRSLRVSILPSKKRLSRRSLVNGDHLGTPESNAVNSTPTKKPAQEEWEDVPASQPGSPDLSRSTTAKALSETWDVAILEPGEPIEIIAETGGATAILPADAHTCETARGKLEGFENSVPKPPLQEAGEEKLLQDDEPPMATQGQTCLDWQHFAASENQALDQGTQVEGSLHDNVGNYATKAAEEIADPGESCEQSTTSEDEGQQDETASNAADQLSKGPDIGQIDASAKLNDAGSDGTAADIQAETVSPEKRRPIARISDDTSMLKAFISRAQAKKAAAAQVHNAAKGSPRRQPSTPRRSPRKILGNLDRNSPSRGKARGTRPAVPGTPPGKLAYALPNEDDDDDEGDEIALAPASQRRSTRTRTAAITKNAATAGPSLIALRRFDGSEPIRIQRSEAQELALATRANTRRNKGRAQMPRAVLQALASAEGTGAPGASTGATKRGPGRPRKGVDWDSTLVYYPDVEKGQSIGDDKARRQQIRGLGSSNGTPGVKKAKPSVPGKMARPSTPRRKGRGKG